LPSSPSTARTRSSNAARDFRYTKRTAHLCACAPGWGWLRVDRPFQLTYVVDVVTAITIRDALNPI
jgi:hypothetical protein